MLATDPKARLDAKHPLWSEGMYHWGEPEAGYFLSKDEYVIRKDMSMLTDAGVDVLIMDVTNAVRYWDEWETIFAVIEKMKAEGNQVPEFCFWAFNGPVITVVQDLYDRVYKVGKYKDLWFIWDGKPLLLYNGTPSSDANGARRAKPQSALRCRRRYRCQEPALWRPGLHREVLPGLHQRGEEPLHAARHVVGYWEWSLANSEVSRLEGQINSRTNEYRSTIDKRNKIADIDHKLAELRRLAANRLLQGTLLNALQKTTVDDIQLLRLHVDQTYASVEGTKAHTNAAKRRHQRQTASHDRENCGQPRGLTPRPALATRSTASKRFWPPMLTLKTCWPVPTRSASRAFHPCRLPLSPASRA